MAQRPGVFANIWNRFWRTFAPTTTREVVGKDHLGNVYYVEKGDNTGRAKQVHRGYLPGSAKKWDDIPVEWEAWLRGRRKEVPGQEEIDKNLQEVMNVKRKAADLDEKYKREKLAISKEEEKIFETKTQDDTSKRVKVPDIKSDYVDPTKEGEKSAFPKYKEFEDIPGTAKTEGEAQKLSKP